MRKIIFVFFALCLCKEIVAMSCFRDPWMMKQPIVCPDVGPSTACACPSAAPQCNCCRDMDNVCNTCTQTTECGCQKACLYFPEVDYPLTITDIKPFYSGSCFACY